MNKALLAQIESEDPDWLRLLLEEQADDLPVESAKESEVVSSQVTESIVFDVLYDSTRVTFGGLKFDEVVDLSVMEPGIYVMGLVQPRINFAQPLFVLDDFPQKEHIFAKNDEGKFTDRVIDLEAFKLAARSMVPKIVPSDITHGNYRTLFDQYGKIVMTAQTLFNARHLIRPCPTEDQIKAQIMISVLIRHLKQNCKHVRTVRDFPDHGDMIFAEQKKRFLEQEFFENLLDTPLRQLDEFIHGHEHFIYFVRLKNKILEIYRTCDWRVYRYYQLIEEQAEQRETWK